jgi:allophanate hydrolase subunit 2
MLNRCFKGRKLIAGDKIPFRHPRREIPGISKRKVKKYDIDGMNAVLRVVLGPQDDYFGKDGIETFLKRFIL